MYDSVSVGANTLLLLHFQLYPTLIYFNQTNANITYETECITHQSVITHNMNKYWAIA